MMNREVIEPVSREHWLQERSRDLTSTEIGALFGISPYMTEFELFHGKLANKVVEIEEAERMKWGNRLQDSIAHGIAEDHGFQVKRFDNYIRMPEFRIGSSFDFEIQNVNGLLEIKNVDALIFRDGWIVEDGQIEAPPHIELQLQHQMLVKGSDIGYIGALVGGNRVTLLQREPDRMVHERILEEASTFWKNIENNTPPSPDFVRDADFIAKLYKNAEPGKIVIADGEIEHLAQEYGMYAAQEKAAKEGKDATKAQILMRIGDASKVQGSNFSITASETAPTFIEAYERAGFRQFRVNFKKVKA